MAEYIIKTGNDYTESYYNKDTGFEVGYYTVNEMKALYPDGGIRVAGQLKYGKDQTGVLTVEGIEEPVYKATSSARYKTIGYVELETGSFLAVKKDGIAAIILFILLGVLLLAGIIFGVSYAVKTGAFDKEDDTTTTKPMIMVGDAEEGEGVWDKLPEDIDVSTKYVTMRGITDITFEANTKKQNFILTNDPKNEGICFMQFTIYLDKNEDGVIDMGDEVLYQSGALQPGYSISHFEISRKLKAGEYRAIVMAQPYSQDKEMSTLNNMVFPAKLTVVEPED